MITLHADVVGSLLRPPDLLAAQKQLAAGTLSSSQFKEIEDRAVDDAIALQEDVGLEIVTDGEMRLFYAEAIRPKCKDPRRWIRFPCNVETVWKGKEYRIRVSADESSPAGRVQARVHIRTDHPREPEIVVPVTAQVIKFPMLFLGVLP